MGAFYVVCEPDDAARARLAARAGASLAAQGFGAARELHCDGAVAAFHGKLEGGAPQVHTAEDGRFAALCGTALVDGVVGAPAARRLLEAGTDLDRSPPAGNYCALVGDAAGMRLWVDPLGVYKVYVSADLRVFSSSFLAVAAALGAITPDAQGVYEYVHQEAAYGGATVAREIRVVEAGGHYALGPRPRYVPGGDGWLPCAIEATPQAHLEACLARLREYYRAIASAFGDRVDTALSGGYDSRLTLALLLEQGLSPAIHVYGPPGSADVEVARWVTAGEGLALAHVDKSRLAVPDAARYPEVVRENFLAFDGWPYSGVFDSGADLATRRARAAGGRLMLNGGGGEIFRNFFYLPDRAYRPLEVVWSFYSRYVPSWCTGAFDEAAYLEALAEKIARSVGGGERLTREQVEYVYPAFRCGYWMGRNNSINGRIGWALTPFIDRDLVRRAVGVPLRLKNHGRFEAVLIRAVSPALARYPSDYGHAFDREPPLTRIVKDHATLLRPPRLRRLTYRLRYRKPHPRPAWLAPEMLERVIDTRFPVLSEFYHVARVNDPEALARIATLEYLFAQVGG